jgi:hypothetical protein
VQFENILSHIHHLAYWWIGISGDLYKV